MESRSGFDANIRTMTVTRFAPSPTGLLHLGHAHSALFARAQAAGGVFLLRHEDIDPGRCRPGFIAAVEEDLSWLGLDWPRPARRQSEHLADYAAALGRLEAMGLLYPCFCTRGDIVREIERSGHAPHGPDGPPYPGLCRRLGLAESEDRKAAGQPFVLRLDMERAVRTAGRLRWRDLSAGWQDAEPARFGDVVLSRKDVPASYHLAVTVDDALQGVTLVTRGADLFAASHLHRLLQALLALPVPDWHHHRLLCDAAGRRLAKRDKALTLRALREAGRSPEQVRAMAEAGVLQL